MLKQSIAMAVIAALATTHVHAQKAPATDTTNKAVPVVPAAPGGLKPYKEVINADAKTQRGLFTLQLLKDHFYFEVPDSLLGRDILVVNRISKAAASDRGGMFANYMYGYAGDEIGNNVLRDYAGCVTCPDQPRPKRVYDGLEFRLRKRFADNWYMTSTYTWSRLYGNYSGLASSDENGRTSPNVNRFVDGSSRGELQIMGRLMV